MIIHGTPNEAVTDGRSKKLPRPILFRFDSEGLYKTDNADILKRAKPFYRITEELPAIEPDQVLAETPCFTCKKCGAVFTDRGSFLLHHRKDHPKEG